MEKLSLKKFEDFEIEKSKKRVFFGGGTETQESCSTGSWYNRDTQCDTYNDSGDWVASWTFRHGLGVVDFDDR